MGISVIEPGSWGYSYHSLNPTRKDLIEFDRGKYHHWAMYIGDWNDNPDMVVHFNPSCEDEKVGLGWQEGMVTVDKLKTVTGSSKVRINNLIDETPRKWNDIKEIIKLLENWEGCHYSLTTNNCENLVTYLRFPVTSGFRCQMSGGLLSWVFPTWHIGTWDNGKMQTKQWDEYVKASKEGRKPKWVFPAIAYM